MTRTVLVVGANGGVGAAITRTMLERGYRVAATVSREEKLAAFRHEFPACSLSMSLDLTASESTVASVASFIKTIGSLDAVVTCSAVAPFAPAETMSMDMFRRTMEINCLSVLAVYQASLPALRRSRGRFVITGSYSGRVATPLMAAYVCSKFALEGLADVLRQEAGEWGVDVVLLQPGMIDTPMVRRSRDDLAAAIATLSGQENALYGKLFRQTSYRATSALDAGGIMSPDRVADAAIIAIESDVPEPRYAVGDDADYILAARRVKSDREMDALVLDIYRSAPI
jgi:NAD(P)-dependent dehydrogenase (short-subunit alcohol dehydrogenase family)